MDSHEDWFKTVSYSLWMRYSSSAQGAVVESAAICRRGSRVSWGSWTVIEVDIYFSSLTRKEMELEVRLFLMSMSVVMLDYTFMRSNPKKPSCRPCRIYRCVTLVGCWKFWKLSFQEPNRCLLHAQHWYSGPMWRLNSGSNLRGFSFTVQLHRSLNTNGLLHVDVTVYWFCTLSFTYVYRCLVASAATERSFVLIARSFSPRH